MSFVKIDDVAELLCRTVFVHTVVPDKGVTECTVHVAASLLNGLNEFFSPINLHSITHHDEVKEEFLQTYSDKAAT